MNTPTVPATITRLVEPGPDEARSWLREELDKPEYNEQGLLATLLEWLADLWRELTSAASQATTLSTTVALILLLGVVALAAFVAPRIRAAEPRMRDTGDLLGDRRATAGEHRRLAESALAAGRYEAAVVEGVRALVRRMADRGVVDDAPGSTAHEIATAVGTAFPPHRLQLEAVAVLFDAVHYGDRTATRAEAAFVLALDDELRTARPGVSTRRDPLAAGTVGPR